MMPPAHAQSPSVTINGMPSVTLTRKPTPGATKPEFTSVTVLPGRGLMLQQVTANFPGKGEVDVLASPSLADSATMLNDKDTANGDLSYRLGAAFLFPYPNRIRGKLSADGKTITTEWHGKTITLPANSIGKNAGAERHAMHGLILKTPVQDLKVVRTADGGTISGVIHGGDFNGLDASIVAHNVGTEPEPVGIGWHPYFNLPSGDRTQVRLHIPGSELAKVDNYDNVFPTGQLVPVAGTAYDFQAPDGKALGDQFLDDNWSHLTRTAGVVVVKVIDPAAKYGVRIEGISPQIKTVQAYAPPTQKFVAIEDQFNFGDPFGKEWGKMDTGMVTLQPGQSTQWHVRLGLFVP
jgi:galactose mutarotase-like enzyme